MKSQRAYVVHVLECIGRIKEDSASGRETVSVSHTLQVAILGNLQVLCESVRRIDLVQKDPHSEIDWKAIAGMRNVLVHDYFDVDFESVWNVVTRDLVPLQSVMNTINRKPGKAPHEAGISYGFPGVQRPLRASARCSCRDADLPS